MSAGGYLLAQPEGIAAVKVRVAGRQFELDYGRPRDDLQALLGHLVFDPNYPNVGFRGKIDTTALPNGEHELEFIGITSWGREEVFFRGTLNVAN